jgi:hypothetical protein
MLLAELVESTNKIFDKEKIDSSFVVPEPSPHWKRKLEALKEAHLYNHRNATIFDMRCEQAKSMGFQLFGSEEYVEMLMGEPHTHSDSVDERQNHEWFYNHQTDTTLEGTDCNWGGKPFDFWCRKRKSLWFLPPFTSSEIWRCRFGKLNYLKRTIPYGVVLRINEVKSLKLFNAFNVFAPIEAWERKTDIDPIVVASIWELPYNEKKEEYISAGQAAHFFLAQW